MLMLQGSVFKRHLLSLPKTWAYSIYHCAAGVQRIDRDLPQCDDIPEGAVEVWFVYVHLMFASSDPNMCLATSLRRWVGTQRLTQAAPASRRKGSSPRGMPFRCA